MSMDVSSVLDATFRDGFDKKLKFCYDLISYTPFSPVMEGKVLTLLHPQAYDVLLASIKFISLLYLLFFVRNQYKLKGQHNTLYQTNTEETLIFPLYLRILSLMAFTCFLQCISSVFIPLELKGRSGNPIINSIANALGIGLEHGIYEGIALLLCFRGVGKRTTQKTAVAATIWVVICFAFALTMNLTKTSGTLRLILNSFWCGVTFLFYLAVWLLPSKWFFRRPAIILYAKVFSIIHLFVIFSNISIYLRYNMGFCALQFTPRGVIAALLPYLIYRVLLNDCEYWLGITGNNLTSLKEETRAIQQSRRNKKNKGGKANPQVGVNDANDDDDDDDDEENNMSVVDALKGITFDPHNARIVAGKLDTSLGVKMISFASIILDRNKKSFGQKHVILGAGSTSRVYRGTYYNRPVAVKMVFCVELTPEVIASFYHEATLLSMLKHKNILHIEGMCVNPPALCLVMELCGGSLMDLLTSIYQTEDKLNPPPRKRHQHKKLKAPKVLNRSQLAQHSQGPGHRAEKNTTTALKASLSSLQQPLLYSDPSSISSDVSDEAAYSNPASVSDSSDSFVLSPSAVTKSSESSEEQTPLELFPVQPTEAKSPFRRSPPHLTPMQFMHEYPIEYWKLLLQTHHYLLRDDVEGPSAAASQTILTKGSSEYPSPLILPDHLTTKFAYQGSPPPMVLMHSPSSIAGGVNTQLGSLPSCVSDITSSPSSLTFYQGGVSSHQTVSVSTRKVEELKQHKVTLSWIAKVELMIQCSTAVAFLHGCNPPILHLDLKSSNFLLGFDGNIKLADLELSRQIHSNASSEPVGILAPSTQLFSGSLGGDYGFSPSNGHITSPLTHSLSPSQAIPIERARSSQAASQPQTSTLSPQQRYVHHYTANGQTKQQAKPPSTAFLSDLVHDVTVYGDIIDHHYNLMKSQQPTTAPLVGVIPERVNWLSPELILGHPSSEKADVYSLGCVFWEICTGHVPFHDIELQLRTIASIPRTITLRYRISTHNNEQQHVYRHTQTQYQQHQYLAPQHGFDKARQADVVSFDNTAHNIVPIHHSDQQALYPIGSVESISSFSLPDGSMPSNTVPMTSTQRRTFYPGDQQHQGINNHPSHGGITVLSHNAYGSTPESRQIQDAAGALDHHGTSISSSHPSSMNRHHGYRDSISIASTPTPAVNPIQAVLKLLIAAHHFRPLIPIDTPQQLRELITHTWDADPQSRPNAHDIVHSLCRVKQQLVSELSQSLSSLDESYTTTRSHDGAHSAQEELQFGSGHDADNDDESDGETDDTDDASSHFGLDMNM